MKLTKVLVLLCMLGFVAAGALSSGPASASLLGNLFSKKQTPVDLSQIYPIQHEDEFQDVAKSYHGRPYNDPELEFEIWVPRDWPPGETAQIHDANGPNQELIGDLARFTSPVINTMKATVTVQSIKLDREISAENWLKNYILAQNYSLQDAVIAVNEKKASANCLTVIEGQIVYFYVTVQFNGNNAIIVKFESPMALKDALAFVRKRVVDSFRFILETDRPIEVQKPFNFSDALKLEYPESLNVNYIDVKDTRHMSMQLFNMRKEGPPDLNPSGYVPKVDGLIRFIVVKRSSATTLKKELEDIKKFIDGSLQLDLKKLASSDPAQVPKRFIFSRYEVYQVASKKANAVDQELRFVALGDKNWYVFALLLTPSNTEDFYAWANNTQDFDMIVRDFK